MTNKLKENLLGALVGLGRAVEGNSNRPTDITNKVLGDGLRMLMSNDVPKEMIQEQIKIIHTEKYRLIPRCTTCKKQCGRNDDYDASELIEDYDYILNIKLKMLSEIIMLSEISNGSKSDFSLIYDALFRIGKKGTVIEIEHMSELVHIEFRKQFMIFLICKA